MAINDRFQSVNDNVRKEIQGAAGEAAKKLKVWHILAAGAGAIAVVAVIVALIGAAL